MHKLLERQLKRLKRKSKNDSIPIDLLLEVVGATYEEADTERRKKDRSVKLMSEELIELNKKVQQESEAYVSTVMENVVDGIITFNEAGTVLSFNSPAESLLGYSKKEAVGKHIEVFSPKINDEERVENFLNSYLKNFKNEDTGDLIETLAIDVNGRVFPIDLSVSEMSFDSKKMYIAIIRDITERKQFEEALIKAKKNAEQMAIAKTNFLSTMSHEIRTPMNAVIGLTNLLIQENPKPEQVESLKVLKFSGENLLVLINDILDFNKIESGRIEFEKMNFSIQEVTNSIKEGLNIKAKEKNIGLQVYMDSALPKVLIGDPTRLSQILNNLIGNAIKFTEKGKVTVEIDLVEETPTEIEIAFRVIDTGIGIEKNKLDHIFESFTQSNSSITRKYGGTGLGLAITKRLIELQDSEIHVKSEAGKGSSFHFTLTFGKTTQPSSLEFSIGGSQEIENFKGSTILLVEDNKINQMVASKFLASWGITVELADDGSIGLEKVQQKDYDLVLMDLQMPVMDGYTATQKIRNLGGGFEDLPIVALTASVMQTVQSKALKKGMNDFVSKPFNPSELNQVLAKFLKPLDVVT